MKSLLTVLLFFLVSFYTSGQIKRIIEYNETQKQLYETIGVTPFQNSEHNFHIRINYQNSVLIDIWVENNILISNKYSYVFQTEKEFINGEKKETNEYLFEKETENTSTAKLFIAQIDSIFKIDSIIHVDSTEIKSPRMCNLNPSGTLKIEYKIGNEFIYHRVYASLLNNKILKYILSNTEFIERLPYGIYRISDSGLLCLKFNPFVLKFTGISPQYQSRFDQNYGILTSREWKFSIRQNNEFNFDYLQGKYPEYFYRIRTKNIQL